MTHWENSGPSIYPRFKFICSNIARFVLDGYPLAGSHEQYLYLSLGHMQQLIHWKDVDGTGAITTVIHWMSVPGPCSLDCLKAVSHSAGHRECKGYLKECGTLNSVISQPTQSGLQHNQGPIITILSLSVTRRVLKRRASRISSQNL